MLRKLNLRQGIIDILVEDDENIEQIEKGLIDLGLSYDREAVRKTLLELGNDLSINVSYPPNTTINNFWEADDSTIKDFWFEVTSKGKAEWDVFAKDFFDENE
jgi:hypothetical protein